MNIGQLKALIKDLPDEMPVVIPQDDSPDYANTECVEVRDAYIFNDYGYNVFDFVDEDESRLRKIAVIRP